MSDRFSDIRLIIFDCDGVLVDSEPLAMRVLRKALLRLGVEVSEADAYRDFLGRSIASMRDLVMARHGVDFDQAAQQHMREELFALYRRELKPIPGLTDALDNLPEGIEFCVASSSQPERVRISLDVTGLLPRFPRRFSASQVENGKPAPDLFLFAAKSCGVDPSQCLVIEDSPAGIAAAQSAGMHVFAFAGGTHVTKAGLRPSIEVMHPDLVFDDMSQLPALLDADVRSAAPIDPSTSGGSYLLAVDVGTASVRAGVLTPEGKMLSRAELPITVHRFGADRGEYASSEIWQAVCTTARQAVIAAKIAPETVAGIGFDATCSLVVLDEQGQSLPVSDGGKDRDTIAWFDHRALAEAAEVTATGHHVLHFSGGVVSPEMEVPKLMWLKRHMPEIWDRSGHFFDLADFLTWKATGSLGRSQSTLTAKWAFLAHEEPGWRRDFCEQLGIGDMLDKGKLPERANAIGAPIGSLTAQAAAELGLTQDCIVATGMIDAHAGALGVLGGFLKETDNLHRHLGLIAGTSSCVIALSEEQRPTDGVWGPYFGAVLPGVWLNEGGQSATGALLDHLIRWHSAGGTPDQALHRKIIARIGELRTKEGGDFAARLHVLPDFHGNRSPLAEPNALGVISGLDMDTSFDSLCRLYWRAAVGIALGLRHILEALNDRGYGIDTLHVTGGHTRNPLLMELYADATGCRVVTQEEGDAVLLGSGMAAASAAGLYPTLVDACGAMSGVWAEHQPNPFVRERYDRDYRIFLQMHKNRQALENL